MIIPGMRRKRTFRRSLGHQWLRWTAALLLCLSFGGVPSCGWAAQDADVVLVVDTLHPTGKIDLTRYALCQGGFSYHPMIDGVIPQIAQLRPQTIRLFVQEYFNLYPDHNQYHWATLDRAIEAIVATGAEPVMCVCIKPKVLFPKLDQKIVYPTSWKEWDTLISRLVRHCNDNHFGIRYWEVGNEVNIGEGGGCPYLFRPQDYLVYYTHTVNAIRRADANAKVGGPALATWEGGPLLGGKSPILDALIDYCGKGKAPLDFISWHLYDNHPELFQKEVTEVRTQLAKYDSLRNAETILDEWNMSLGSPILKPDYQPAFIMENTYRFYQAGLSRSGYYQIKDVFFDPSMFSSFISGKEIAAEERFFNVLPIYLGLYDLQRRVRPSYYALKLLSLIKGEKITFAGTRGEIKGFAVRDKGSVHLVFWNFPARREGNTLEVTLRFPYENSGGYHLMRLDDESPVNNLEMMRSGSMKDLKQSPLRVTLRPYDVYWLEISP